MRFFRLHHGQQQSLGIAAGIVAAVFFGSVFLTRLLLPGSAATTAGWEPSRIRQEGSAYSDAALLSGLRIPSDLPRKRLVAVMVENHEGARPFQMGLRDALMIWEFPVEGFISRFAAVFDADDLPKRIGPVRSLRPYYIDALQPFVATVIHAGGSPEAFEKANRGDIDAINLLANGKGERDETIPAPHNLFIRGSVIRHLSGLPVVWSPWPAFPVGGTVSGAPAARTVTLNFNNPAHDVTYHYDFLRASFIRSSGTVEDQGHPQNVLILEMPVTGVGEYGRLTIPVESKGRALLFRSGTVQEGTWAKNGLLKPFIFAAADGSPFIFAPGQIWATALPSFDRVTWLEE